MEGQSEDENTTVAGTAASLPAKPETGAGAVQPVQESALQENSGEEKPEHENPEDLLRKFPRKKLPGMLKKSYTEQRLAKKILKPIVIPADRELLKQLFVQGADAKKPERYAVPEDRLFSKKELKKYKLLVGEIKSRKGRFLLLPFAAVIVLVAAVVAFISAFKNPIAKKAIIMGCEAAAGAKTDVGSVNLSILGGTLTVRNIAVGNKNSVMKNLAEAEKIELSFNLAQALRGKLDVRNLELSGLALNTDRTESCELPAKPEKEKKAEEEKASLQDSEFMLSVQSKSNQALADLKLMATDMLGGGDVETIVSNIRSQLKSPAAAQAAVDDVQGLITKWQGKPEEIKAQVDDFSSSVKKLQTIDLTKISDPQVLQDTITKIKEALAKSESIKQSAESLTAEVTGDGLAVKNLTLSVTDAVTADKDLMQAKLTGVVNVVKNANLLFNDALDTVGYDMLGKYYPYIKQVTDYAARLKTESAKLSQLSSSKPEKKESPSRERMKGTTYWYTTQNPTVLVERMFVSGNLAGRNFEALATEVTNDQNARGKTTSLSGTLLDNGVQHAVKAVLDIRAASTAPLITADYDGSGFSLAVDGTKIASRSGVPSLSGNAAVALTCALGQDNLSLSGSVDLQKLVLTTDGFENEFVTKYYRQALDTVKSMVVGYKAGYAKGSGVNLALDGDFADVFAKAFDAIVKSLGDDAKNAAFKILNAQINDVSNGYLAQAKQFLGIEGDIDVQNVKISDVREALEKKSAEAEQRLKDIAKDESRKQIQNALGDNEFSNAATDAAGKMLDSVNMKDMFKNLNKQQ